jgi:hypothetical protein
MNASTHSARNQFVCQYAGAIEKSSDAPFSFQTPLLLAAVTRKRWLLGSRSYRTLMAIAASASRDRGLRACSGMVLLGRDEAERRIVDLQVANQWRQLHL